MSNAIYPVLKGLSYSVTKTPSHRTLLQESVSGRESAAFLRAYPRYHIRLKYEYIKDNNGYKLAMEPSDLDKLIGMFNQMHGSFDDFLLLDTEGDSAVSAIGVPNNVFAIGDGVTAAFQMTRIKGGFNDAVYDFITPPNVYQADWRATPVNFLKWSEDFTQASWVATNGGTGTSPVVTGNSCMAPDNTIDGEKVAFPAVAVGGANFSGLMQQTGNINTIGSRTFTFSVFLRADVAGTIKLVIEDGNAGQQTILAVNVTTSWQRYSVTMAFTASAQTSIRCHLRNSGGSAAVTVYGWGAQLDEAAVASSYIETRANAYAPLLLSLAARKNFLLQTEALNTTWAATGTMTVTTAAGTAPDGNNTGNTLNDTDAANASLISQAVTIPNDATSWDVSVYIKQSAALVTAIKLALTGGTGLTFGICFDPSNGNYTGMAGATAPAAVTVQKLPNGWYRVSFSIANNASGNVTATTSLYPAWTNVALASTNLGTLTASVVAATGATFFWGTQLENSSTATAYIKNIAAANTISDYAITSKGVVQLAVIPASGIPLWADLSFYWRVRFENDEQDFDLFLEKLYQGEVTLYTRKP